MLDDWNYRTLIMDVLTLEENKFVYKKIISEGKGSPRYSNPKKHEMGEMKRALELRVDEVSVQKLRENHETIQKLTSQLQELQDQMNSMSESGEFQEVK